MSKIKLKESDVWTEEVPTYWVNQAMHTKIMQRVKNKQPFMLARDFGVTREYREHFSWSTDFDIIKDEQGRLRVVVYMAALR